MNNNCNITQFESSRVYCVLDTDWVCQLKHYGGMDQAVYLFLQILFLQADNDSITLNKQSDFLIVADVIAKNRR